MLVEPTTLEVPRRVNPYSIINIMPFQEGQSLPPDPDAKEENVRLPLPSMHSVPIPCGYAMPCKLLLLLLSYCSPGVIHTMSPDKEHSGFPSSFLYAALGATFV